MRSLETALSQELNKIYDIRWGLKTRVHTKGMQRNRKPETNSVSLSREPRYSWRDGTYCKGNSVHSRSLPPLVNHCNIHVRGNTLLKPTLLPRPHPRTFNPHAKLFAYRPIGPSNCVIQLKLQPRSNCGRVVGCYRLKLRKGRRENMNGECNENTNEKFIPFITSSRIEPVQYKKKSDSRIVSHI